MLQDQTHSPLFAVTRRLDGKAAGLNNINQNLYCLLLLRRIIVTLLNTSHP